MEKWSVRGVLRTQYVLRQGDEYCATARQTCQTTGIYCPIEFEMKELFQIFYHDFSSNREKRETPFKRSECPSLPNLSGSPENA